MKMVITMAAPDPGASCSSSAGSRATGRRGRRRRCRRPAGPVPRALAAGGPATRAELAARTGTDARHVGEWLAGQAAGGYACYDHDHDHDHDLGFGRNVPTT